MKRIIVNFFTILSAALMLTSCLKDKGYIDVIEDNTPELVVFAVPGGIQSKTLANQAEAQTFEVQFGLSTINRSGDVTVNIAQDDASVAAGFLAYPSANVSISPASLIFAPGEEFKTVTVTVINTNQFDACTKYMIPLVAAAAGGGAVAATNQKALVSIPVASPYSGTFLSNGYFDHPTAPRPIEDLEKELSTENCVTVSTGVGDLSVSDDFQLGIEVDTTEANKINGNFRVYLSNLGAGPAVEQINDTESNFYNAETKTFDLNYRYLGGNGFRTINEIVEKQ